MIKSKKIKASKLEDQSFQEKEEELEDDFIMDYSSDDDEEEDDEEQEKKDDKEDNEKPKRKRRTKKEIKNGRKNGKQKGEEEDLMDSIPSSGNQNGKKDDKSKNKSEIWNDFLQENKTQLKLFKVIERQMLQNFKIPECAKFIPSVDSIIQTILDPTEEYKKLINEQLNDHELQHYLNKCKEDLYKQLVFQYRDQVKASVHLDWVKSAIRSASESLLGCERKNHNLQKDIIWFHILITFSSKLLRESDDESFDFQHRVSARISYLKIMSLILQIESTEFATIFKRLFE